MNLAVRGVPAFSKSWKRAGVIALVCFISVGAVMAAIDSISFLDRLNQQIQDWEIAGVFAPTMPQDPDIVIVAIDEPTLATFKYRAPVDRAFLSNLINGLAARRPRAIGLDILLDQPTDADKDAMLKETLAGLTVPLVASYIDSPDAVSAEQLAFENAMLPPRTRGLADLRTDQFDTARNLYPGKIEANIGYVYGFAPALARAAKKNLDPPRVEIPIAWHGHPAPTALDPDPRPFRQVPALAALAMPDDWYRGKIVIIGTDVTLLDRHRTPYSIIRQGDAGQLSGVVIQAHAVSQLLNNRQPPQVHWVADFAIALVLAALGAGLGAVNYSLGLRLAALVGLAGLFWVGGVALYHGTDIMIGLLAPPVAMIAGFTALDLIDGRAARQQRKFIQDAMSHYVSRELVQQMVDNPRLLSLKGERRAMTFLFSDIQDFTALSEKMDSEEITLLVNGYLSNMTRIVHNHGGMVDKFIGDSVFAIFNAPLDLPDHPQKGVECMLEMDEFCEKFRVEQAERGITLGPTRIGVHTGSAVIGNFGSEARLTYTAQGDAVNTASRLESVNKQLGTRLCVSDASRRECRGIAFRPVASAVLKGKSGALDLWEPLHEADRGSNFLAAYCNAYDRLKAGEPEAAALFQALDAEFPDDPCIRLHLRRIAEGARDVEMVMSEK